MSRPTEIRAGDTYEYNVSSDLYPASDGWTLKVTVNNSSYRFQVSAATNADGESYDVTFSSANTDDLLAAGKYALVEAVEKGSGASLERHTIYSGVVDVLLSVTAGSLPVDFRTDARIMLDTITATMKTSLGKGHESMQIAARAIGYRSWEEMLKARERLMREVKAEENAEAIAQGLEPNRPVLTRFGGIV